MLRGLMAFTIGMVAAGPIGMARAHAQILPDFGAATFDGTSFQLTNPYFPFTPGKVYRYEAQNTDLDTL